MGLYGLALSAFEFAKLFAYINDHFVCNKNTNVLADEFSNFVSIFHNFSIPLNVFI